MTVLVRALAEAGADIDLYVPSCPVNFGDLDSLRLFTEAEHDSALGKRLNGNPLAQFAWAQWVRGRAHSRLVERLVEEHRRQRYDVIYQFSQPELLTLRRRRELPPIVVHPEVHAAGELAWHRREDRIARQVESRLRTYAVRGMLSLRAAIQRRDLGSVEAVICPSEVFARLLVDDYRLPPGKLRVVPNPVDLKRFKPAEKAVHQREIVFVSRMSVRKGVELIVDLSKRLDDLSSNIRIKAIGNWTMWSDYRSLLRSLNPQTSEFIGYVESRELPSVLARASLLIQPSHYEPFALTVAEALASGTPVVASDQVGAMEWVSPESSATFPAGNAAAFEHAVRGMLARIEIGEADVSAHARADAEKAFAPAVVAEQLLDVLKEVAR